MPGEQPALPNEVPGPAPEVAAPATEAASTAKAPESPKSRSSVFTTIGKIAGAGVLAAALAVTAIYSVKKATELDRASNRVTDIHLVKISMAIRDYRAAVKACMEKPGKETAEALDSASVATSLYYLTAHARLSDEAKGYLLADITALHENAKDALERIEPRSGYTQHYLDRLDTRHSALLHRIVNNPQAETTVWEKSLEESRKRDERFKHMTPEERRAHMRKSIAMEAPKK